MGHYLFNRPATSDEDDGEDAESEGEDRGMACH